MASKSLQNERLIYGYCRNIQSLLKTFNNQIPNEIINLCIKFHEMTAILNISLGQCGNLLMTNFYESIYKEYNIYLYPPIEPNLSNPSIGNTYLRQENSIHPRCIAIDFDSTVLDIMQSTPINEVFVFENVIYGKSSTYTNHHNMWPVGMYKHNDLKSKVMDCLRKEIEKYDEPQAFQFMHSIAGAGNNDNYLYSLYLICNT